MRVEYSTEFKKNLLKLSRRYRRIRADVEPIIQALMTGETSGDRVSGVGYPTYKVRIKNRDAGRGKSGGYRCLYYLCPPDRVLLVTIYSKSDADDVPTHLLRRLIEEHLTGQGP